jgi:hypothetical protein
MALYLAERLRDPLSISANLWPAGWMSLRAQCIRYRIPVYWTGVRSCLEILGRAGATDSTESTMKPFTDKLGGYGPRQFAQA